MGLFKSKFEVYGQSMEDIALDLQNQIRGQTKNDSMFVVTINGKWYAVNRRKNNIHSIKINKYVADGNKFWTVARVSI
jgi:hypothetical protein